MVCKRVGRAALGAFVAVMAIGVPAGTAGAARGHVYTMTNAEAGNAVMVFNRDAKGRLYRGNTYLTGGKGLPGNPDLPLPIVDSQNTIALTPDGRVLFVVNAGSDTVTSFRVSGNRLIKGATAPSGGTVPDGVDARNGILYVSNAKSATIAGFRYDRLGNMTPIAGSVTQLPSGAFPAAIKLGASAQHVVVTERVANQTQKFPLTNGVPGAPTNYPASGSRPYALALTSGDFFITSDEGNFPMTMGDSRLTTYRTDGSTVSPLTTIGTNQSATCWIVISRDGRYGWATSAVGGAIQSFSIGAGGAIQLLDEKHVNGFLATDIAQTADGRYFYVTATDVALPENAPPQAKSSHIEMYRIGPNGGFTRFGQTPPTLLPSISGMAAT